VSIPDIPRLVRAIRDLHGLDATHVRSEDVREMFRGKVAWEGTVEVFAVSGHPRATTAYAWSFENDAGNREYVAVLGVPPVNSALDAVRAAIAAEIQRQKP
jgi:hypothetical protein